MQRGNVCLSMNLLRDVDATRESNFAQQSKIIVGILGARAGGILVENDIENPMTTVFNTPMFTDDVQEGGGIGLDITDVVMGFMADFTG